MLALAVAPAAAQGMPTPARTPAALTVLPTLTARIGPGFLLSTPEVPSVSSSTYPTGLVADVLVGGALGWPGTSAAERLLVPSPWLFPELGYSYRSSDPDAPGGHLGTLGIGVGYGQLLLATVGYVPRLVVGSLGGEATVGLRHGLQGRFLGFLFSVEIAHQMLRMGGGLLHEIQLSFGLNLGSLFLLSSPFR
jgi:hypothetical protein